MIPRSSWMQIYISYKLMRFVASAINTGQIENVRCEYKKFSQEAFSDGDSNPIDSIPNLISFVYLLLVRSEEITERYISAYKNEMYEEIERKLNPGKKSIPNKEFASDEMQNFLLQRYHIIMMIWENRKEMHELRFLVKKIRNSISHFRYEIHNNNVLITDYNEGEQNFRISMKAADLLNLTIEFVSIMNEFLTERKLIDNNK